MYRILYNDQILFDPYGDETEFVTNASMHHEINSSSYLDFVMSYPHPMYDKIAEHDGIVRMYWDSEVMFEGVIESIDVDIEGNKSISCVSALDYLNDTLVRPYSTTAGEYELTCPTSLDGYFQWLIDQHNTHVLDSNKVFEVGINQAAALKTNNYITISSSGYSTTANEITNNLLDNLGGYLSLRYDHDRKILDLYSDVHEMNAQIIDFGVNITDFTKTTNTEDQYTALIVTGGTPSFVNGDFETGTFEHWDVHPNTSLSKNDPHGGSYASYFVEGRGEYVNDSYFYSTNGSTYKSTIFVRNERSSDVKVHFGYQYFEFGSWKNDSSIDKTIVVKRRENEESDYQWVECSVTFTVERGDGKKIRPRWYFDAVTDNGQRIYVDDFDFVRMKSGDEVSEEPVSLRLIQDGTTSFSSDMKIHDDVLYSESSVSRYGYRETTWSDESIIDIDDLVEASITQLNKLMSPTVGIDVKAVDLSLYMDGYDQLRVGQAVRVRSRPHNVDEYLIVSSIDLDLQDPGQTEYSLGVGYDTLTGQQSGFLKSLNASINSSLDAVAALDSTTKNQAIQIGAVTDVANSAQESANNAQQAADQAQNTANNASNKADQAQNAADNAQQTADSAKDKADQNAEAISEEERKRLELERKTDSMIENVNSFQQQTNESFEAVNKAVDTIADQANAVSERAEEITGQLDDANAVIDRHEDEIGSLTTTITNTTSRLDTVETSVGNAQDAADKAQQTADEVKEQILTVSTEFSQTAEEIRATAESAYSSASEALTQSSEAVQTANSIRTTLEQDYSTTDELEQTFASKSEVEQTATNIKSEVSQTYATKSSLEALQNIADSAIQTWTGNGIPTLSKPPANQWTTTKLKQQHSGDLYYDNETGYAFRFGSSDGVNFTWGRIADSDITKALADAAKAQETAEGAIDEVEQLKIDIPGTYATKSEVTQTADSIRSEVSANYTTKETFENLQIGGTNVARDTRKFGRNGVTSAEEGYLRAYVRRTNGTYKGLTVRNIISSDGTGMVVCDYLVTNVKHSEYYTLSFWAKGSGKIRTYFYGPSGYIAAKAVSASNGSGGATFADGAWNVTVSSSWQRYFVVYQTAASGGTSTDKYMLLRNDNDMESCDVCGVKIERGSKPTNWSPAPEDIDSDISDISGLAQSALDKSTTVEQDLDGFRTTVSETYTTKTEFNNLKIGGTNLLPNTGSSKGYGISAGQSNLTVGTDDIRGEYYRRSTTGTSEVFISSNRTTGIDDGEYTVSFWYRVNQYVKDVDVFWLARSVDSSADFDTSGGVKLVVSGLNPTDNTWTYWSGTFTAISGKPNGYIRIDNNGSSTNGQTATLDVTQLKLERGNKATAWSPAPEDIDENFADLADIVNENNANVVSLMETSINQAKDSITSQVAASYYTKTEAEELMAQMSTQFQQTEDSFEMEFNSLRAIVDQVNESADTNYSNIQKYIRFVDGHIIIGVSGNPFSLDIGNDRISFMQNNSEIAYISNHEFYITSGIITQNLRIGNFEFRPRSNGNLSLSLVNR